MLRKRIAFIMVWLLIFTLLLPYPSGFADKGQENRANVLVKSVESKGAAVESKDAVEKNNEKKEDKAKVETIKEDKVKEEKLKEDLKEKPASQEEKHEEDSPKANKEWTSEEVPANESETTVDALEILPELEVAEDLIRSDIEIELLNKAFLAKLHLKMEDIVADEFLAKLKNGKMKIVSHNELIKNQDLKVPKKFTIEEALLEIEKDEEVLSARPLYRVRSSEYIPNDPYYTLYATNPDEALWGIFQTNGDTIFGRIPEVDLSNVKVAVVDSGIMTGHEDLTGVVLLSANLLEDPNYTTTEDDYGHGTHVAGTIAAVSNDIGIVGVASDVRLISAKVLDGSGNGNDYSLSQGILWAVDNGADVINMSLGLSVDAENVRNAVQYAAAHDVVMVAAAGNGSIEPKEDLYTLYPAAYPEVINVGAVAWDSVNGLKEAWFSNPSNPSSGLPEGFDTVDVVAPGMHIISTYIDPTYYSMNGTSMSTSHVTGLAALIRAANGSATMDEVKEIINGTAQTTGLPEDVMYPSGATFDEKYGEGLIDFDLALDAVLGEDLLTSIEIDSVEATEVTATAYETTVYYSKSKVVVVPHESGAVKEMQMKLEGGVYETVTSMLVDITSDATTVMVKAIAFGGTVEEYTLTILRAPISVDSSLGNLEIGEGTLEPTFDSGVYNYGMVEGFVIGEEWTIDATPSYGGSTIAYYLADLLVDTGESAILNLADGPNTVTVKVTAENGDVSEYVIEVSKAYSNADLLSLEVVDPVGIAFTPGFEADLLSYTMVVSNIEEITLSAVQAEVHASMKIDGVEYVSGTPKVISGIVEGDNVVSIVVTAQNGDTKNYELIIHKQLSENKLADISVSEGSLVPVFDSLAPNYNVSVNYAVREIIIDVTRISELSTVVMNGNVTPYAMLLEVGENTCEIVVTAENGETNSYTLYIHRAEASNDASLLDLTMNEPSGVAVSPTFESDQLIYAVEVTSVDQVTISAVKSDANAVMKINGVVYTSGSMKVIDHLVGGENLVTIEVTAENGDVRMYQLTISREVPVEPPTTPSAAAGGGGGGGGGFTEPKDTVSVDDEGNVTTIISFERIERIIDDIGSTLVIDTEGDVRESTVSVQLSKEIVDLILSQGKNLKIEMNGLTVSIPYELLSSLGISDSLEVISEKISDENIEKILIHRPENTIPLTQVYEFRMKDGKNELKNFGEEIQYTVDPDDDLVGNIKNAVVYYISDQTGLYEMVSSRVVSGSRIFFETNHTLKYVVLEPYKEFFEEGIPEAGFGIETSPFTDMETHWAQDYVEELAALGIVKGVTETEFQPDTSVTRAQFTAYLDRALDLQFTGETQPFIDVSSVDWFYGSVMGAYEAGIVSGINAYEFKPNEFITREQMAVMLVKAYAYKTKVDINTIVLSQEIRFSDQMDVSPWALRYVLISNSRGYIVGDTMQQFKPGFNASRAEAVVVITKLIHDLSQ